MSPASHVYITPRTHLHSPNAVEFHSICMNNLFIAHCSRQEGKSDRSQAWHKKEDHNITLDGYLDEKEDHNITLDGYLDEKEDHNITLGWIFRCTYNYVEHSWHNVLPEKL